MAQEWTVQVGLTGVGVDVPTQQVALSAGGVELIDESVPDSSTDLAYAIGLRAAGIKVLLLVSDQDLTIETNDGTTPDDEIELAAGVPLLWFEGCGFDCPIGTDVTGFFLTNASGATAALQGWILQDPTA